MFDTTLFNKNHIEVHLFELNSAELKQQNQDMDRQYRYIPGLWEKNGEICPNYFMCKDDYKEIDPGMVVDHYLVEESPLGFYYINGTDKDYRKYRCVMREYRIIVGAKIYVISYPVTFGDVKVDTDSRPWTLLDNGMGEHFIFDLHKTLVGIKDDIDGQVKKKRMVKFILPRLLGDNVSIKDGEFGNEWRQIMIDMFGNADGPKFQTNDEKVLAAGFDLKTSFRKMLVI